MSALGHGTYATFRLDQTLHQARRALQRDGATRDVAVLWERLRRDEARIRGALGRETRGLRVLEIGPGQDAARARYFALDNDVTALDLDVIPRPWRLDDWVAMLRVNGPGRAAKTLGRKLLGVDRRRLRAWEEAIGRRPLPTPRILRWDIGAAPPAERSYDLIVSWSVFEHLPDPAAALDNAVAALRPGGVLYLGIHLYTSNNGHHDIRSFTQGSDALPPWAHLRPKQRHLVRPSAYLNRWRLADWRALFADRTPGAQEFCEGYGDDRRLTPDVRQELGDYTDEELLTVDAFYLWRRASAES